MNKHDKPMLSAMGQAALKMAKELSWRVFPCSPENKRPIIPKSEGGKGFKDATAEPDVIIKWWTEHPNAMIGVATGAVSGFFAVDLDRKENQGDGLATWHQWEIDIGASPISTRQHKTPSTGRHLLFRYIPGVGSVPLGKIGEGVEIKGDGGYIIVPPSVMSSGLEYKGNDADINDAPDWFLDKLRECYDRHSSTSDGGSKPTSPLEIEAALDAIPCKDLDYYSWLYVGSALHKELGDKGKPLFLEWSKTDKARFNLADCSHKWDQEITKFKKHSIATLFYYADEHDPEWRDRWKASSGQQRPYRKLRELRLDTTTWDDGPAPPPEYAVHNRIPAGETTLFWGPGGAGKSIMLLHLSVASVLAQPWLGITPRQGPAIFVDAEDRDSIIRYRGERILQHCDAKWADVRDKLHPFSLKGEDAVLVTFNRRSGKMEATPRYKELREMVGDIKPSIIGIASAANVFAGSELDRTQVMQFIGLTDSLAMLAGSGLVLVGHPSLTGINTGTGTSGSTQWHNACRARLYLRSPNEKNSGDLTTDFRLLEFMKNQYGSISESIMLQWQDGLFLPVEATTFDAVSKSETAKAVFVAILRRFQDDKRRTSSSEGKNYAPKLFADQKEAKDAKCTKQDLKEAMEELLRQKRITIVDVGPPSKRVQELRLAPAPGDQEELRI